ncbi:MAG: hypothetical protein ABL986_22180 [Vicinamibacterales bacterium]
MSVDSAFVGGEELLVLQARLHEHFARLSQQREGRLPVFALEHGLSEGEVDLLAKAVRWSVRRGTRLSKTPLPLVVYAAEAGYSYDGGEFWESFASKTPGWLQNGDRSLVRRSFEQFAKEFGGARPTGAWARQFSIICWPILHAVLPRIFQRQLARVLYENRWRLSPALIEDPLRLGTLIETWSWGASDRFRNLAQNRELLGQVASALLLQSSESAVHALLPQTVERVIVDLSGERDAKRWLKEASRFATNTAARGFAQSPVRTTEGGTDRSFPKLDPVLSLQKRGPGWAVVAELPDIGPLVERFPELGRELSTRRCFVAGRALPLPRSALLWPGQSVEFDEHFGSQPFLRLEGSPDRWTPVLGDFCRLPSVPWLFRVQDGEGTHVLGRFVRPGARYIVATEAGTSGRPGTHGTTGPNIGLSFYEFSVPDGVDTAAIAAIESLGLSVQSTLEAWPAGICNAGWDGVGAAVWLEGDPVQIGIEADRALRHLIVSVDGDPYRVSCEGSGPTFLDLGCLALGIHSLQVEAFDELQLTPITKASMQIQIRTRQARPITGSLREGLALTVAPISPMLNELLEGSCSLNLVGPPGARLDVTVSLASARREVALAELKFNDRLPVVPNLVEDWASRVTRQVRVDKAFVRRIEEADLCTVRFSHPDLGAVELRAEREFAPIRLASGIDHDGRFARLIDNMDGQVVALSFSTVEHPDRPLKVDRSQELRFNEPGLLTAAGGEFETSLVLVPDRVRDFRSIGAGGSEIRLERWPRSVESIRQLCNLAYRWRHALKPDLDASLTVTRVLRAITCDVAAGVGGRYWAAIEHRVEQQSIPSWKSIQEALGHGHRQAQAIQTVQRRLPRPANMSQQDLVRAFDAIAAMSIGEPVSSDRLGAGEFCLRLASQPAATALLDDMEFDRLALITLDHPVLLRLARYVVLQVHEERRATDEHNEAFAGLRWD